MSNEYAKEARRLDALYMKALDAWNRTGPSNPKAAELYLEVDRLRLARDEAARKASA